MSAILDIVILAGGPVLGASGAIALDHTRPWQVMAAAVLGEAVAYVVLRVWSEYTSAQALGSGRNVLVAGAGGLGWRGHLRTVSVLGGFAVLLGGLVALVRALVVRGR